MYRDFGAAEWFFEVEETSGAALSRKLLAIHGDPATARAKVRRILSRVAERQRRMVEAVRAACQSTIR
jgi:hypothetical protein